MNYIKKPIPVEAWHYLSDRQFNHGKDLPKWLTNNYEKGILIPIGGEHGLTIKTLEGDLTVKINDWIIQGIHGEIYPCKPDIFAESYEIAKPADMSHALNTNFDDLNQFPMGLNEQKITIADNMESKP